MEVEATGAELRPTYLITMSRLVMLWSPSKEMVPAGITTLYSSLALSAVGEKTTVMEALLVLIPMEFFTTLPSLSRSSALRL